MRAFLVIFALAIGALTAIAYFTRPTPTAWHQRITLVNMSNASTDLTMPRSAPFRAIYQHDPVTVIYPKDGTGWRYDAGTWRRVQ